MIRAPSRSVHGLPNPNVGGAVVCGQMASLCAVYKLGVAVAVGLGGRLEPLDVSRRSAQWHGGARWPARGKRLWHR